MQGVDRNGSDHAWEAVRPSGLFTAGSANVVDGYDGNAGFFGDSPVLLFYCCPSGRIAVDAAEHDAWHPAIGPPGAIFVNDVEHHEFGARRWLFGHLSGSHRSAMLWSRKRDLAAVAHSYGIRTTNGPTLLAPGHLNHCPDQMLCKFAAASLPRSLTTS